jgi:hypothetical protein
MPTLTISQIPIPVTAFPVFLYALYLILYQPYKTCYENIASFINMMVVCIVMGFREYMEILSNKNIILSIDVILYLLLCVVVLMVFVAFFGAVSCVYVYRVNKKILEEEDKIKK